MGGVRRPCIQWTPAMIERLLRLRRGGATIKQIADAMGLSHGSIGKQLDRLGLVEPRAAKAGRLSDFAEMLAEGSEPRDAARAMGLNPDYGNRMFRALCAELGEQAR